VKYEGGEGEKVEYEEGGGGEVGGDEAEEEYLNFSFFFSITRNYWRLLSREMITAYCVNHTSQVQCVGSVLCELYGTGTMCRQRIV
jgi:hypothetical protein